MNDDKLRGKHLAHLRRSKGLKQIDLADLLHYTDKNISKWENGKSFPTDPNTLNKLAEVLNVSVNELIYGYKENIDLNDKKFINIIKNNYLKHKKLFIIFMFIILFNYIFLNYFCNSYYAVVKSDNIMKSYIKIKFEKEINSLKLDKIVSFDKHIKSIIFYYKINGDEYLLFDSINDNLLLVEESNYLEYDLKKVIKSSCYLELIYIDNTSEVINVKFRKFI